jgi:16S rRNA (adenine1518-N6/adenine1519-N6)-dimethyltransferase
MELEQIQTPGELVRRYQRRAKKALGQHFLVDPNILNGLIEQAGVQPGDRVLEVGAGCGTLTLMLVRSGASVTAVELDSDAVPFLQRLFADSEVDVRAGDILEMAPESLLGETTGWRAVANLPYQVATEVYFHLAPSFSQFERLVLMFQREVAERMVAGPEDDEYGALALQAQLFADLEIVQTLPGGAFKPPPKVSSAAVRVDPIDGTRIPDEATRGLYRRLVKQAFQRRRKILPNALGDGTFEKSRIESALRDTGIDRRRRPEVLGFEDYVALSESLMTLSDASSDESE